jgi:hypothetical protein
VHVTEQLQGYLADNLYLVGFASMPFFRGVQKYVTGYQVPGPLYLNLETAWSDR